MKFLTDQEIIALYFKTSGRFGPAGEIVKFAREVEALVSREVLAETKASLKWMAANARK